MKYNSRRYNHAAGEWEVYTDVGALPDGERFSSFVRSSWT
jgi:hypothetical protein